MLLQPTVCIFQPTLSVVNAVNIASTLCSKFANSSLLRSSCQKSGVYILKWLLFKVGSWWRKYVIHLKTNYQKAPWLEITYGYPITLNDYSALCTRSCHEPHTLALRAGVLHGLVYQKHTGAKSFLKEHSLLYALCFHKLFIKPHQLELFQ